MSFRFEKLEVWKQARGFVVVIYKVTSKFPEKERYGLIDQTRRAAVSIVLNIAEGSNRGSDKDFARFLRLSVGSIDELVTALYIAKDLKYVSVLGFTRLYDKATVLSKRIHSLIKSISKL